MKKFFAASVLLVFLLLPSCSGDTEKKRFVETYKEILLTREKFTDTTIANRKVHEVLQKNGYTDREFRRTFFKFAENKLEFIGMIDSARAKAKREFIRGQQPPGSRPISDPR